ncbi:MAG TPA: flippase-like domain-containing protein [Actinomycetota bacterium]|nr:flippase-like domain-containing protein [Actinomycetota bacterium]
MIDEVPPAPAATPPPPGPLPRARARRRGWLVAAAGAAIAFGIVAAFDRSALVATGQALQHLRWGWIAVAVAAEAVSMLAAATGHRRLLQAGGELVPRRTVLAVAFAGTALASSVPFAGTQMAVAYSLRQYRARGIEVAVAGWALAIAWLLATLSFATVLVAGSVTSGSGLAAAAGLATSLIFLLPPIAALLGLRYPPVRTRVLELLGQLVAASRARFGRPKSDVAATVEATLVRIGELRLRTIDYGAAYGCYLTNWLADVAVLVCAFKATGAPIPWMGLLLAYGAGITADSLGLTPGGLGLVEAALTAALVAAGLRTAQALSAVLVYRFVSFWLLLVVGWVVMVILEGRKPGWVSRRAAAG